MKDILLPLFRSADRPIVYLSEHGNLAALLDTGAPFPVWTASKTLLEAIGGRLFKKGFGYSGIGGPTIGDVYKIPSLIIGSKANALIFPELPVVTNSEFADAPFELLLSNTMFHDLDYLISNKRHSLTIYLNDTDSNVRNAIVNLDDGFLVLFTGAEQK